jgi:carboxypeptidase C (cathepsin A)
MTCTNFAIALVLFALPAFAQNDGSAKPPADAGAAPAAAKSAEPKSAEPMKNPLPADKSVPQTITVNGKMLHYTATVGTVTLKSKDDKPTGVVMYTAYTLDEPKSKDGGSHRPITFALNGGPGASSVYLNLGAIGPKHLHLRMRVTRLRTRRR